MCQSIGNGHFFDKLPTNTCSKQVATCQCQSCHLIRLGLIDEMVGLISEFKQQTAAVVEVSRALEKLTKTMKTTLSNSTLKTDLEFFSTS